MTRLARLARMPPAEMAGRVRQALSSNAERLKGAAFGPSEPTTDAFLSPGTRGKPGGCYDAEALWGAFRNRAENSPFPGLRKPRETVLELHRQCPDEFERTLHRAQDVVDGHITLLGCRIRLSEPPDWHLEPVTELNLPLHHWTRIDHLNPQVAGEYKVLWELNRHQYLLALGQAHALTGEQQYARLFRDHLSSWMDDNPPGWGIHWSSSLEISYRAIAWIWSLHLFRDSPLITEAFFARCLKFLSLQGHHIERHLSTFFSPNTHLTGEALGLLYLGVVFPELPSADRWREIGARILREQLPLQVRGDGVYFEQASAYHAYTVDIYLHADLLLTHLRVPFSPKLRSRILDALAHLRHFVRPDGMIPLWGDDDGGRLLPLTPRAATDFSDTLSTGAYLFQRGDLLSSTIHPSTESVFLLGSGILSQKLTRLEPEKLSTAFSESGVYVLRDGWAADSSYVMVSCGPHGSLGGGHAHADALSIEVTLRGTPVVIDPGTFTYRRDAALRNDLRSAWAHNSVVIDETPFAVPGEAFSWETSTDARVEHFFSHDDFDFFRGVLNHPLPDRPAVRHVRTIFFLHDGCLLVWDQIQGEGPHGIDLRFHLAPDWDVETGGDRADCIMQGGQRVAFHFFGSRDGHLDVFETFVSGGYGEGRPSRGVRWKQQAKGAQDLITVINPDPSAQAVSQFPAPQATLGLSIEGRDFRHILLLGQCGRTTVPAGTGSRVIEVEGEVVLLWISHSRRARPQQVHALLARRLLIDGLSLVTGKELIDCAQWELTRDIGEVTP